MKKKPRKSGTPSPEEWNGFWEVYDGVPDIDWDTDEHGTFYLAMTRHLNEWLKSHDYESDHPGAAAYFRGDCYIGDRTEYLEITDASCLDMNLLSSIQDWLQRNGNGWWRVLVVTYSDRYGPIFVYPSTIRLNRPLASLELDEAMRLLRDEMQQYLK